MDELIIEVALDRAINLEAQISNALVALARHNPEEKEAILDILYILLDLIDAYKTIAHDLANQLEESSK